MLVVRKVHELQDKHRELKLKGKLSGFVPTMGALHQGHLALVKAAKQECDITIVSIFVNPTQFNNPDDYANYPLTLDADLKLLEPLDVDLVFIPNVEEMYPEEDTRRFDFEGLDESMEGKFRPGHFNGVAQVVSKLFNLVEPDFAYFGEKDFQQLAIIQHMTRKLNYSIQIVSVPTMREPDGLAMSSRNMRLNAQERKQAVLISRVLFQCKEMKEIGDSLEQIKAWAIAQFEGNQSFVLEYIEIVDAVSLEDVVHFSESKKPIVCIAAHLGNVRLIDNIRL